jgi:hypothetical protein
MPKTFKICRRCARYPSVCTCHKPEITTATWGAISKKVGLDRLVRRLIGKYKKKRAKYYQEAQKATKRQDIEGQLIFAAYQMAYTEMQTDLERVFEPSNENNRLH